MDPGNALSLQRLSDSVAWSRKQLQPFRMARNALVREYTGPDYGSGSNPKRVPINLIELAVTIYIQAMAAQDPSILVSSDYAELSARCMTLRLASDKLLKEIDFLDTIQTFLHDALFSMGIMKTGTWASAAVDVYGRRFYRSMPFANTVDLDDWVHDMNATRFRDCFYQGNGYRLPVEFVKNADWYDGPAKARLSPTYKTSQTELGDEKTSAITQGAGLGDEELEPSLDLMDLWFPNQGSLVTFVMDRQQQWTFSPETVLRVQDWNGPKEGPYEILAFNRVPSNSMPNPVLGATKDLHALANVVLRKLASQAVNAKTVLGISSGAKDDGRRITTAGDGEAITVDNPERIKELRFNGVDPALLAFCIQLKDFYTYLGGNLDAIGGLGPQSPTLGQDELLHNAASSRISFMNGKFMTSIRRVCRSLVWYLYHDPFIEWNLVKRLPGTRMGYTVKWRPEDRTTPFDFYAIDVEPYSTVHQTPQMKLMGLQQFLQEFAGPLAPMLQAQGIMIDFEEVARLYADYSHNSDIDRILILPNSPMQAGMIGDQASPMETRQSPFTNRTQTRVNVRGATLPGRDNAAMQSLLSMANMRQATAGARGD